jgi:hypothetical protein
MTENNQTMNEDITAIDTQAVPGELRSSETFNKICRQIFSRKVAEDRLEYLQLLHGMMSKNLNAIDKFGLTEVDINSHAVYRASNPDPKELDTVTAMDSIAERHMILRERWADEKMAFNNYTRETVLVPGARGTYQSVCDKTSLWCQIYYGMETFRGSRNYFAHSYHRYPSDDESGPFRFMKQLYGAVLPAIQTIIDKLQAAIDDKEYWLTDKVTRMNQVDEPEYALDCDLVEAERVLREACWAVHAEDVAEVEVQDLEHGLESASGTDYVPEDGTGDLEWGQSDSTLMGDIVYERKHRSWLASIFGFATQAQEEDHQDCEPRETNYLKPLLKFVFKTKIARKLAVKLRHTIQELQHESDCSSDHEWIDEIDEIRNDKDRYSHSYSVYGGWEDDTGDFDEEQSEDTLTPSVGVESVEDSKAFDADPLSGSW